MYIDAFKYLIYINFHIFNLYKLNCFWMQSFYFGAYNLML